MYFKQKQDQSPMRRKKETEGIDWLFVTAATLFGLALSAPIFLTLVAGCK